MTSVGQPTGGSLKPGSQGGDTEIIQIGPTISIGALTPKPDATPPPANTPDGGSPDPDAVPKFTITETRGVEQKFGEPPRHTRKFRAVQEIIPGLTTTRSDVTKYINASVNSPHPEFPGCVLTEYSSQETVEDTERSKQFITEISTVYSIPPQEQDTPDQHPLTRPDTWSFQTQGASISALYYFDGNDLKPLTNSAGDYIKGLQGDEAQTKVVIKGNRAVFPSAIATALTNCVNDTAWLGGGQDQWKCQGISGQLKYESVNEILVRYWEVSVELLYRQTGWNLLIPDVGFNFIAGGQKRRAMVFDPENNQWIASADPVALDGAGGQKAAGQAPEILTRRLYRRINFNTYFGSPPS